MNDNELMDWWNQDKANEQAIWERKKEQLQTIANSKSNDIFKRIERNIILESLVSVVLLALLSYVFYREFNQLWFAVALAVIVAFGFVIYGKYLYQIKSIQEVKVVDSLNLKINILKKYIYQLKLYNYVFTPIGFVIGLLVKVPEDELALEAWFWLIGISVPILGFVLWLMGKYIYKMYGRHLESIQAIYTDLTQTE